MPSLSLHVDNLKCAGCSTTIRRNVLELPGAVSVNVDPDGRTVRVEHDGSVEHDVLATLLAHLGYPEQGTGGSKEKATSYLSCAVGRLRGED